MKQLILCGILLGMLMVAGCANNELLQCQKDKDRLAGELRNAKAESNKDITASIELLDKLKKTEDDLAKA